MLDAYFAVAPASSTVAKLARKGASRLEKRRAFAASKAERNKFYYTRAWQELRYRALKLYGKKCGCCESVEGPFHIDHIKPRSKYPELELEISNLQVLCKDCNLGKGGWDDTDWRPTERAQ